MSSNRFVTYVCCMSFTDHTEPRCSVKVLTNVIIRYVTMHYQSYTHRYPIMYGQVKR